MADRQILPFEPASSSGEGERVGWRPLSAAPLAGIVIVYIISGLPVLATQTSVSRMIISFALGATLVLLSTIDIRSQRLPDIMTLPLVGAGILVAGFSAEEWQENLLAAFIGFLMLYGVAFFYRRLRGKHGLGLGDARLLAASGAWVGLEGLASVLLFASASAIIIVFSAKTAGFYVTRDTRIPFGPFLALATWIVWLYGPFV